MRMVGVHLMLGTGQTATVRPPSKEDAGPLSRVFASSWRNAYTGIIPAAHLAQIIDRRDKKWWQGSIRSRERLLLLEFDDVVAGYATFGPERKLREAYGEIFELYLDPTFQGLGFGELLFEACRTRLDMEGFPGLVVWALSENTAAQEFYWHRGGRPIATSFHYIEGKRLEKTCFGWDIPPKKRRRRR